MSSQILQTEALVLRNLRFGETSRVATLFTRAAGKIGAIGKGARTPKSAFGSSLELMNHSAFVLYYRPGRDLQFLKEGEVIREFRGILTDWRRYTFGAAWAEFLDRALLEDEPSAELFSLALRGFDVLESSRVSALPEFFRGLQLRLVSLLGYAPRLDLCGRCAAPVPPAGSVGGGGSAGTDSASEPWLFSVSQGLVYCPACAGLTQETDGILLTPRELRRLRSMAWGPSRGGDGMVREPSGPGPLAGGSASGPPDRGASAPAPPESWVRLLDRLVEGFLRYHLSSYRGLRALPHSFLPPPGDRSRGA